MAHTALDFSAPPLTTDQAVTAALTANDYSAEKAGGLGDGTVVTYGRQPTLDELQHIAKQLLPQPTSAQFANTAKELIGANLKATAKKGKKGSAPTQAAIWAGNVRRLAREIAGTGKVTGRAAGKHSVRTKATSRTGARDARLADDAEKGHLDEIVSTYVAQQAPAIGVEIVPPQATVPEAYYVPANAAVWRMNRDSKNYCFANQLYVGAGDKDIELVGFSTADGVESKQTKIYQVLQHVSVVTTGLVSILCHAKTATRFKPGDPVYITYGKDESNPLRRKPNVTVSNPAIQAIGSGRGAQWYVGRFIDRCGPKGGIRVRLDIARAKDKPASPVAAAAGLSAAAGGSPAPPASPLAATP